MTPAPPNLSEVLLRVAQAVPFTEAEGPGKRFALWFQGCPLRCPSCCNTETLPSTGGAALRRADVVHRITEAANRQGVEGITLLGAEPLAHAALGGAALARR